MKVSTVLDRGKPHRTAAPPDLTRLHELELGLADRSRANIDAAIVCVCQVAGLLKRRQAVCDGDVLELTNSIVKKSLIVMNQESGSETRYRFHETIRQYAYEKLIEAGEEREIRTRHLKYFLKLSEEIEQGLVGPQQLEWFALTNDERNNLHSAMEHAYRTDVESGLYISSRLELFWINLDSREGTRRLAEFLQKPESNGYPHARAKALYTQGRILFNLEQFNGAQAATEKSLALFRAVGDRHGEVDSLVLLGIIFMLCISDPVRGVELAQQALILAQSLGDIRRQASALNALAWDHRDYKRAFAYWEEAIALYRHVGHWGRLADNLSQFGFFLLMDGQVDAAKNL